ncbi:MAG TPA: TIGR02597 family protein [Chthoniobacteraceae bacterium]|jgi:uncharacterized protein (TIGR02597 family)
MKTLPHFLTLLVCSAAFTGSALAQTNTAPVGFLTYSFPATATATTSYLSTPLGTSVLFSGKASGVSANVLAAEVAGWQVNEFISAGTNSRPSFLRITSGAQVGRVLRIVANDASTLTLDVTDESAQTTALNATGFALAVGDSFEISAAHTLRTALGEGANAFPGQGASLAAAGGIGLWNAALRKFDYFYWSTTQAQWVKDGAGTNLDAGGTVLPPNATLAVFRPAGQPADSIILTGRAATVAPLLKHSGASSVRYSGMHVPVAMTLSQVSLGSNWVRGTSAFTADTLSLPDGTTTVNGVITPKWAAYFQLASGEWRKSGSSANQNSTVIPAGSAVAFLKRASVTGSGSFLALPLPYTP